MRPHMLPPLVTVNRMKTAGFPWFIGEYGANGQTRELIVSDLQLLGWIWRLAVVTLAVGKVGALMTTIVALMITWVMAVMRPVMTPVIAMMMMR